MSKKMQKNALSEFLSLKAIKDIDHWIAKYPAEQRQSAVMAALRIAQEECAYLSEPIMEAIATYLEMPLVKVCEVASFYTMYFHSPQGRHSLNVCTNVSCKLSGSSEIVDCLQKKLNIKLGETTVDGRFTLRSVECLGACVNAPMMQIDRDYHEHLTIENMDSLLEQYP